MEVAMQEAPSEALMGKSAEKEFDLIEDTVSIVENLDKEDGIEMIKSLLGQVDYGYFQLGGALSIAQREKWWQGDYGSFKEFIEDQFGLNYRKAMYLIQIYNGLVESGVEWAKVKDLGWSKLKELSAILTEENVDEWVDKAEGLTVIQLIEAIRVATAGSLDSNEQPESVSNFSTITFKVADDQKESIQQAVEKALSEADTEYKGVALEAICLSYLAGGKVSKSPTLRKLMEASTPEQVLETFAAIWPEIDVTASM